MVMTRFLFTSESVTEGHPDKVADQISDAILDAHLAEDPQARVACETLVAPGVVVLAGEITSRAKVNVDAVVRAVLRRIGYDDPALGFTAAEVAISDRLGFQSREIGAGVDVSLEQRSGIATDAFDAVGAGDQGMMFGYATNETEELMPLPIAMAHRLARRLAEARRSGELPYLRPDGKTQVTVRYEAGRPATVERVLISAQHSDESVGQLREDLARLVVSPLVDVRDEQLIVNPAGSFTLGGPAADAGLTGRKIIVDTYGGIARHGGGAFSGKDPSKVDRSAAYAARHVAKHIVAAGLAERCEVQVAYAIGMARPVSLMVSAFGTGVRPDEELAALVLERFDLRPGAFREALDLHQPIYGQTAAYGHFGRPDLDLPWERLDRLDFLT